MKFCPSCRSVLADNATSCMVCGENLGGGATQVKTAKDGTEITSIYAKDVEVTQSIYATDSAPVKTQGIYEVEQDDGANKEIMDQINEYKKEGYIVKRLEQILANDPDAIWDKLVEFQSDIEKLQELKKKAKGLDSAGFETERKELQAALGDPDRVEEAKRLLGALEGKIASAKAPKKQEPVPPVQKEAPGPLPGSTPDAGKKKGGSLLEVIKRLTQARKAFTEKNYPVARTLYKEIMDLDPSNDEAHFYIDKINQLAPELSSQPGEGGQTPAGTPNAPPQAEQTQVSDEAAAPQENDEPPQDAPEDADAPVKVMMPKRVLAPRIRTPPPLTEQRPEAKAEPQAPAGPGKSPEPQQPAQIKEEASALEVKAPAPASEPEKAPSDALNLDDEDLSDEFLKGMEGEPFLKDEILDDLAGTIERKPETTEPAQAPEQNQQPAVKLTPIEMEKLEARAFNQIINRNYEKAIELYDQILRSDPNFKDIAAKKEDCQKKLRESKGGPAPAPGGLRPKPVAKKPVPVKKKPVKKA